MRIRESLLLTFVALGLAGCGIFGGDEPADPPAELTNIKQAFKVRSIWSVKIGGKTENLHLGLSPVTDGARVYAANHDGNIVAVDTINGKKYWEKELELPLSGGPGVGDGLLAIGTGDGDIIALNTINGDVLWHVELSGEVLSTPAVAESMVVVRTVDGRLHGLSAEDGSERWVVEQEVPRLSLRGNSNPVIVGNVVVCGFDDGRVMAIAMEDGETIWDSAVNLSQGRTEIERLADVDGQVLVLGDDVFATSYQGRVAMLDLRDGQNWWQHEMSSFHRITSDGSTLYLTSAASHLLSLARRNGEVLWEQDALHRRGLTAAVVYGPALVTGDFEGYLHWIDRGDGKLVARNRVGSDRISGAPLVLDELVYVQTDGGRLSAFRADIPVLAEAAE